MPKDRGAEQGDVDGPFECSSALGLVAAETRGRVAARLQPSMDWVLTTLQKTQRLQAEHTPKMQRVSNFLLGVVTWHFGVVGGVVSLVLSPNRFLLCAVVMSNRKRCDPACMQEEFQHRRLSQCRALARGLGRGTFFMNVGVPDESLAVLGRRGAGIPL